VALKGRIASPAGHREASRAEKAGLNATTAHKEPDQPNHQEHEE
jgi:hypothetical protein